MIAYLKGTIKYISIKRNFIILENNGIGYRIFVTPKKNWNLGDQIDLFIYTYKRENELKLIGFNNPSELELFEDLISVSGVGPKVAVTLIHSLGVDKIVRVIQDQNIEELKIKGVGKKTAQKIILELKGVLVKNDLPSVENNTQEEVVEALKSLGYNLKEINSALEKFIINDDMTEEDILKGLLVLLR